MMQPFIFMILSLFRSHITLLGYRGLLSLVCLCGCCLFNVFDRLGVILIAMSQHQEIFLVLYLNGIKVCL